MNTQKKYKIKGVLQLLTVAIILGAVTFNSIQVQSAEFDQQLREIYQQYLESPDPMEKRKLLLEYQRLRLSAEEAAVDPEAVDPEAVDPETETEMTTEEVETDPEAVEAEEAGKEEIPALDELPDYVQTMLASYPDGKNGQYLMDSPEPDFPYFDFDGDHQKRLRGGWLGKIYRKTSSSLEKTLGKAFSSSFQSLYGINDDPELNRRLNRVVSRLNPVFDRKDVKLQVKIINQEGINAFAVPGGYIYLTTELIQTAVRSDSELAAVIAHEMGHIEARHSMKRIEQSILINQILSHIKNKTIDKHRQTLMLVEIFASLRLSRKDEHEADRYGVKYLTEAGYNPLGMASFLSVLKDKYEQKKLNSFSQVFLTHPSLHEREKRSAELAQYLSQRRSWPEQK